jgi:biopolymer transport protein ExbB
MGKGMLKRVAGVTGAVLLLNLVIGLGQANAWWDAKWEKRRKVSFDTTDKGAAIADNLTEVPVLVRLHSGNFTFDAAKEDGADIRFVSSDDKTPLKYHLEKYEPKQGIALFWVKVPQIAGKAAQDFVWCYYGNSSAAAGADSGGTYDTAQAALFHFSEKDGPPRDATAYGNHAAEFNGKLGAAAAIGNGAVFSGAERLVIKRAPSLNLSKGFTFSAWLKPGQLSGEARLLSWDDGKDAIIVAADQSGAYARAGSAATGRSKPLTAGAWQHLAVVAEPGKKLTIYLNGQEAAATPLSAIPSPSAELAIGATLDGKNGYVGEMDEAGIAAAPRSPAWIAAAVAGQGQDGKLAALLQEEAGKGGEGDLTIQLMKIIAKSITLDGWLVIGLCTGMLLLAVFVFVKKFLLLNNIQRDNKAFLEAFQENHDPLAINEADAEEYEHSSLYRIYRAGHDEIVRWLSRFEEGKELHRLSPAVINIYRAALDKASAKETHRLNAWLIVMTLSISGGPFWGLLGTVWGVMNTFAALAASGEANLSAIAPGVASALACTLFGLFVAIPSLFAYSYLTMRMKIINSDTRIFIDELHVKIEGTYGESA